MKETTAVKKIENRVSRLTAIARVQAADGKLEEALNTIATCALTQYTANQRYMDPLLEDCLAQVAWKLPKPQAKQPPEDDRVLFYDGFGLANRGLVMIYLEALCPNRKVTLVTRREWEGSMQDAIALVESGGGQVFLLEGQEKKADVLALQEVICSSRAKHLFMYANADDVVVTTAFLNAPKDRIRYQINLTDHAFWLGSRCADKYIEFRDYGGAISHAFRAVPKEKLVKLPFYPQIGENRDFAGYPFPFDEENQLLVFSGGALYKTQSPDNYYYKIVETMLQEHPQVVFWYAGSGDGSQLKLLAERYPGRVWHTPERRDLFGVIGKSLFYLSTYPICGGLMFQYAAAAGKVPVTLKHDSISDGFLLGQDKLGIEFTAPEEVNREITRLIRDKDYLREKEEKLSRSVQTPESFARQLTLLMETGNTAYPLDLTLPDTLQLQKLYASNYSCKQMSMDLVRRGNKELFFHFPVAYTVGFLLKGWKKLRKNQ